MKWLVTFSVIFLHTYKTNAQNNIFAGGSFSLQHISQSDNFIYGYQTEYHPKIKTYQLDFIHRLGNSHWGFSHAVSYNRVYSYEKYNNDPHIQPTPMYWGTSPRAVVKKTEIETDYLNLSSHFGFITKKSRIDFYCMGGILSTNSFHEKSLQTITYFNFHYDSTQAAYVNDGYTYEYSETTFGDKSHKFISFEFISGLLLHLKNKITINTGINYQHRFFSNGYKVVGISVGLLYRFGKTRQPEKIN